MSKHWIAGLVGAAAALAGCSDEADPTEAFCTTFGAGETFQWTACSAGCTLANPTQAYDRNLNTAATVVPVDGQATYTAVLTATAVNDIPGGADAGVFVTHPTQANYATTTTLFRTLRNGVEQETLTPQNEVISYPDSGTAASGFHGMRTTKAFDQLEFTATMTWASGQIPAYHIYEICSDGGAV